MKKDEFQFKIETPVNVVLENDLERFSNGWMMMAITEALISKDGKGLGSIRFDIGGTAIQGHIEGRSYSINVKDLWPVFVEADRQYMEANQKRTE